MTVKPIAIPAAFQTVEPKTREDLRRLKVSLEQTNLQLKGLQDQIDDLAEVDDSIAARVSLLEADVADHEARIAALEAETSSSVSELWAAPEAPHANDQEFVSSTLPSGFSLWEITTNPATAGTIVSGIDYLTQPAAGTVRIEAHKSGRRSWLLMQPRGNNENWFYGCQVTLGNAGHVFRSRIRTHIKVSGGLINAGNCHFAICRNDADKPNFSAGLPGYHMLGGWNASAANQMNIRYALRSNVAGAVTVTTGPDLDQVAGGADVEIAFVLRAGTSTWDLWLRTPSISYHVGAADFSSSSLGNGNTVWVGWNFTGQDSDKPSAGIVGADFWRQEDSNTGFIP